LIPILKSFTALVMDLIAIGIIFANRFVVAHGGILPFLVGLVNHITIRIEFTPILISITVLEMDQFAIDIVFTPSLISITVLEMDHIAIRVEFLPILISITVLEMDLIAIGIVFNPRLISITVLEMDLIAIGIVFANRFGVAHGGIIPQTTGLSMLFPFE
jgi:hypothetical protein